MPISILRRIQTSGNHGIAPWFRPGEAQERGSYPERGKKTAVLLDAAHLFGKLHFSPWPRCHNSFPPKSCTISTFRKGKRHFFMVSSCAAIPRTSCVRTLKSPRRCSPSGTARQSATRSFAIFLHAWWITGVTSWPSSILWWVRMVTLNEFSNVSFLHGGLPEADLLLTSLLMR